MMPMVNTVRGAVEPETLGRTLAHEHPFGITPEIARDFPELSYPSGREAAIAQVARKLQDLVDRGIGTVIDCTCLGHGRDLPALIDANARVDINIVAATGVYTFGHLPRFFELRTPGRTSEGGLVDVMAEMFIKDIESGIQGTEVRAGIIKCATGTLGITQNIDRILRATSWAHRQTGVPITTHTDVASKNGLDQQRVFREEGVDLSRVVIGHSGDSSDIDYLAELADAGSFLGADRFGYYVPGSPQLGDRIETVARLCERGYADRVLLAHDSFMYTDWWEEGSADQRALPPQWTSTHISDDVLPAMLQRGISQEQIDMMLVDNPRRLLGVNSPY